MESTVPYLEGVRVLAERIQGVDAHPFNLPFVAAGLDLSFRCPVTFFVGENGTGKSTLIEALAVLCRLPVSGGSRNELGDPGPEGDSSLSRALRPLFRTMPKDGFFLRAEFQAHFASLLDERASNPDFAGNPYARYGGRSLHSRSHGEAFLAVMQNRMSAGLFLLDEPESALSPQRQLALLALIHDLVQQGRSQFVIATHSPILMTFPGAQIISFDDPQLPDTTLELTSHYQITRGVLERPQSYWRHLSADDASRG